MVSEVNVGRYRLGYQSSPQEVALAVYGDVTKVPMLLKENPDIQWGAGDMVLAPNKKGCLTEVQQGETTVEVIKRCYPHQPSHLFVDAFLKWNNGLLAEDLVGQVVFIPHR